MQIFQDDAVCLVADLMQDADREHDQQRAQSANREVT